MQRVLCLIFYRRYEEKERWIFLAVAGSYSYIRIWSDEKDIRKSHEKDHHNSTQNIWSMHGSGLCSS